MAEQTVNLTSWAGNKGYVRLVYDDTDNSALRFLVANGSTRGSAFLLIYNKQGNLVDPQGQGYTREVPAGSEEQTVQAPNNLDLREDGSLNGWRIQSRGPAS